jgi:hypothetical protein
MTLVDLSEEMLVVSRQLNPECQHHQGDMRTVRLGRTFDAVSSSPTTPRRRSSRPAITAAPTTSTVAACATWSGRGIRTAPTPAGLFSNDVWLRLLAEAGFEPEAVTEQTTEDRTPRELFVGHRRG